MLIYFLGLLSHNSQKVIDKLSKSSSFLPKYCYKNCKSFLLGQTTMTIQPLQLLSQFNKLLVSY